MTFVISNSPSKNSSNQTVFELPIELNFAAGFPGAMYQIQLEFYNTTKKSSESKIIIIVDNFYSIEKSNYYKTCHPLSKIILFNLFQKNYTFKFGYTTIITVKQITVLSEAGRRILFIAKIGKEIWEFENQLEIKTIYIYENPFAKHLESDCECITAYIRCANTNHLLPINAFYDSKGDRYFINKTVYDRFVKLYGIPIIDLKSYSQNTSEELKKTEDFTNQFSKKSKLTLYGYSVSSKQGLSEIERWKLLASLIDNNVITKYSIIAHLDWCIHFYSSNPLMVHACDKWKRDLDFVYNYKKETQRKVRAKFKKST